MHQNHTLFIPETLELVFMSGGAIPLAAFIFQGFHGYCLFVSHMNISTSWLHKTVYWYSQWDCVKAIS
jgi:hypothetical protein